MPHTGDDGVAVFALVADQIVLGNKIALAFDQQLFAVVTIGVGALVIRNVAEIDISDTLPESRIPETLQSRHRGGGDAVEFIARKKP